MMPKKLIIAGIVLVIMVFLVFSISNTFAQTNMLSLLIQPKAQIPLPGSFIPQFVDPLPDLLGPDILIVAGTNQIELRMEEFMANVMPSTFVPASDEYDGTWVWGYLQPGQTTRSSYIGPVIVAKRNIPTEIKFVNNLGNTATSKLPAYTSSTDQTIHWADPFGTNFGMSMRMLDPKAVNRRNYSGPIPAVPHLHGAEVPPLIDGGPDAWFTSYASKSVDRSIHGPGFYSKDGNLDKNWAIYRYPNTQESAPLWFHDHTLGVTRLNVYAGLAGAYVITDKTDPQNLPPLVPLVVQDRMFDITGQLYFPADVPDTPNWDHPRWTPEFLGDTIVVNGKVWPYLNVEPKRYRLLFYNGSNARAYEMFLANPVTDAIGPEIWQIGTDGGYLDYPVLIDPNASDTELQHLVMMPGERADTIVDFSGFAPGTKLVLRNIAGAPYPNGDAPDEYTTGQIMQFRVVPLTSLDTSYNPANGAALRSNPVQRLVDPAVGNLASGITENKTRQLTLNEVMGEPETIFEREASETDSGIEGSKADFDEIEFSGGPLMILVNNTKWNGKGLNGTIRRDFTPISVGGIINYYSEVMDEGDIEVWEIVNLTEDAHPIHTHLTQFQLINRQDFSPDKYRKSYERAFPGGHFIPAYGPPLDYNRGNSRALGGNPDINPYLQGSVFPPAPNEASWKDTIMVPPGMVTRIAIRFAPMGLATNLDPSKYVYPFNTNADGRGYAWHCHIVDHEDNEMMRPDIVLPKIPELLRTYKEGIDY